MPIFAGFLELTPPAIAANALGLALTLASMRWAESTRHELPRDIANLVLCFLCLSGFLTSSALLCGLLAGLQAGTAKLADAHLLLLGPPIFACLCACSYVMAFGSHPYFAPAKAKH